MTEQWRPVIGWPYEVSSLGRVRRIAPAANSHRYGEPLRPAPTPYGHLHVNLMDGGRLRACRVHQLVAEAFIGPYPPGYEIDHVNGNPADNRPENLEYVTHKENLRRGRWRASYGLTDEAGEVIRDLIETGLFTAPDLAHAFGVTTSASTFRNLGLVKPWLALWDTRPIRFWYRVLEEVA